MAKNYVDGTVIVAFRPEVEHSDIEKILGQYVHEKVFDKGQYDGSKGRVNKALDRLYLLTVPAGDEADVINELQDKYGPLMKYVHQPAARRIRR